MRYDQLKPEGNIVTAGPEKTRGTLHQEIQRLCQPGVGPPAQTAVYHAGAAGTAALKLHQPDPGRAAASDGRPAGRPAGRPTGSASPANSAVIPAYPAGHCVDPNRRGDVRRPALHRKVRVVHLQYRDIRVPGSRRAAGTKPYPERRAAARPRLILLYGQPRHVSGVSGQQPDKIISS